MPLWHAANSAGILLHPESHLDAVRPGLALYGGFPAARVPPPTKLRQAMTLKTRIVLVRDFPAGATLGYGRTFRTARASRIAALPIGYADGFSRANSNKGQALVRGRRAPIVGRVSMDTVLVDVTDVAGAQAGDEAVLYGRQGAGGDLHRRSGRDARHDPVRTDDLAHRARAEDLADESRLLTTKT